MRSWEIFLHIHGGDYDFLFTSLMNTACLHFQNPPLQLTRTHQCSCLYREQGVWGWQGTQGCLSREDELTVTPPHPQAPKTLRASS